MSFKLKYQLKDFFKKHNVIIKLTLGLSYIIFLSGFSVKYLNLTLFILILKSFIRLVKVCSAIIGSFIVSISLKNIVTSKDEETLKNSKSILINTLIGLSIVFFGNNIFKYIL